MKQLTLLSLLMMFVMSSCEKDLYDAEAASKNKNVSELIIPQNFNWEMSRQVTSRLSAAVETRVSLFLAKECTEETKIAEYTLSPTIDGTPIVLDVPTSINKIYVKEEGKEPQEVTIENNSIQYTLPATTTRAATQSSSNKLDDIFYSTWYTILLEDQFPQLGDYDFNDFVANYRYRTHYRNSPNRKKIKLNKIEVDIRINAIGGHLPYHPFLRINGLNSANKNTVITGIDGLGNESSLRIYEYDNGNRTITLDLSRFSFKPEQNKYINTLKEEEMTTPKTVAITIDFKNQGENINVEGIDVDKKGSLDMDLFLMKEDMEIHKKGMTPLNVQQYPHNKIHDGEGNTYYCNYKNLVWAIEVPALIPHAVEKGNFSTAYPHFNEWVTSGGEQFKDWYKVNDKNKVIDLSSFWNK